MTVGDFRARSLMNAAIFVADSMDQSAESTPVRHLQLLIDRPELLLNRHHALAEVSGNFAIAAAVGDQQGDFPLAGAELRDCVGGLRTRTIAAIGCFDLDEEHRTSGRRNLEEDHRDGCPPVETLGTSPVHRCPRDQPRRTVVAKAPAVSH